MIYLETDNCAYRQDLDAVICDAHFNGQRFECAVPLDVLGKMADIERHPRLENLWEYRSALYIHRDRIQRAASNRFYRSPTIPEVLIVSVRDFKGVT